MEKPLTLTWSVEPSTLIRALYGTGYGVGGVGLAVFGVGIYGKQVHVEGRWRF